MHKFFGHLNTVMRHRRKVIYHCSKVGILRRGLLHDLSKYSPTEFFEGVRHFIGTRSPNEGERALKGYSNAWMHHKGRNRHHFEYWTDYSPVTKLVEPVKMPIVFVKEMFCDRVAASKVYQGKNYTDAHPYEYFQRGKDRRKINQQTSDLIEGWLIMLRDHGEKETFRHIKSVKEY